MTSFRNRNRWLQATIGMTLLLATVGCQSEAIPTTTSGASSAQAVSDQTPTAIDTPIAAAPPTTNESPNPSPSPTTSTDDPIPSSPPAPDLAPAPTTAPPPGTADVVARKRPDPKPAKPAPAPVPTGNLDQAERDVVTMVNAERAKVGCRPLQVDNRLVGAARGHSQDMARRNYFSHTSPDGRDPFQRMRAAGYPRAGGENIAAGQRTPTAVMNSWMRSSGHRTNILKCGYKAIGVGVGRGGSFGIYWTQTFGF